MTLWVIAAAAQRSACGYFRLFSTRAHNVSYTSKSRPSVAKVKFSAVFVSFTPESGLDSVGPLKGSNDPQETWATAIIGGSSNTLRVGSLTHCLEVCMPPSYPLTTEGETNGMAEAKRNLAAMRT